MESRGGEPLTEDAGASSTVKPGLSGVIGLFSIELLDGPGLTDALAKLEALVVWAQAGQAEVMHLLEDRFQDEMRHHGMAAKAPAYGRRDPGTTAPTAADPSASGWGSGVGGSVGFSRLRRADE
ncbi:hypothetical protein, partial [Arthrobacter sp. Br18]|uniref:hypothetical protein n=1 Tax=Arthrobacter sp. Br18 TaxID=1312954 RepID=UPI00138AAF1F